MASVLQNITRNSLQCRKKSINLIYTIGNFFLCWVGSFPSTHQVKVDLAEKALAGFFLCSTMSTYE